MLGRTDSRSRLLLLLDRLRASASLRARRPARVLAGRSQRDMLAAQAHRPDDDHRSRSRAGAATSTTGAARSSSRRPSSATGSSRRAEDLTAPQRAPDRRRADRASSSSTGRGALALRDKLASGKAYVILRPRASRRAVADRIRAAVADQRARRDLARAGADARLPAGRRRPGLDPGGAPARLRQPRGRRASTASSRPTRTTLAGAPRVVVAERDAQRPAAPRRPRSIVEPGVPGQDLRLTIDAGLQLRRRAGAARGLGRRQGQERLGRRHGPVHRRGLRRGDLSVVRRQRLPRDRDRRPGAVHRPGRLAASTSPGRCSR